MGGGTYLGGGRGLTRVWKGKRGGWKREGRKVDARQM